MGHSRGHHQRQSKSQGQAQPSLRSQSSKHEESDRTSLCLIAVAFTLASTVGNLQVILRDESTNKEYNELVTGTFEVAICSQYIYVRMHELVPNLQPTHVLAPFKSWIVWPPDVRIFRDTAVLVIISYVILVDINLSFLCLFIFPVMAIFFIRALYMKLYRRTGGGGKATAGSSNVDEKTIKIPVELEFIVMITFGALLVMDQLPDHVAEGYAISQFLLFLSSTLAALTRMMMKLPAGASPGIAPSSELLHKTLLLLLLVTVHTVAAEAFGEDVVLICMPEVVPVLLWFSLHLDSAAGGSSIISVDKIKLHIKELAVVGAAVVAPLFAYLGSSMDGSGLSWCTTISMSCGVSGILTYYLVFVLRHWPRQQAADAGSSSKDVASSTDSSSSSSSTKDVASCSSSKVMASSTDSSSSNMLKLWADALLIAAAALLLLRYVVSVQLEQLMMWLPAAAARLRLPPLIALAAICSSYGQMLY